MKELQITKQFKKDVKRVKKQGKDHGKLKFVINVLYKEEQLGEKYKDHKLSGDYQGARECHIEPDWLLIYESKTTFIKLRRTGSHAEFFNM